MRHWTPGRLFAFALWLAKNVWQKVQDGAMSHAPLWAFCQTFFLMASQSAKAKRRPGETSMPWGESKERCRGSEGGWPRGSRKGTCCSKAECKGRGPVLALLSVQRCASRRWDAGTSTSSSGCTTFCHNRSQKMLLRWVQRKARFGSFWSFLCMLGTVYGCCTHWKFWSERHLFVRSTKRSLLLQNFQWVQPENVGTQADRGSHGLRGTARLLPFAAYSKLTQRGWSEFKCIWSWKWMSNPSTCLWLPSRGGCSIDWTRRWSPGAK